MSNKNLKIVVVGNNGVGKTCFLISFANNMFPDDYVPTVFDNYNVDFLTKKKERFSISLWDTACSEDYDRLRPLCYPETDIVFMLYSLNDPSSLENIEKKWLPEIEEHTSYIDPKLPKILIGTKSDLERRVDLGNVRKLIHRSGKFAWSKNPLIVSSKNLENLSEVFDFAIEAYLRHKRNEDITRPKSSLKLPQEEKEEEQARWEMFLDSSDLQFPIMKNNKTLKFHKFLFIHSPIIFSDVKQHILLLQQQQQSKKQEQEQEEEELEGEGKDQNLVVDIFNNYNFQLINEKSILKFIFFFNNPFINLEVGNVIISTNEEEEEEEEKKKEDSDSDDDQEEEEEEEKEMIIKEKTLKKMDVDELIEHYIFFSKLKITFPLLIILKLIEGRHGGFEDWYILLQKIKKKMKEIIIITTNQQQQQQQQHNTFETALELLVFNKLKDSINEVQTNPEILEKFSSTIFSLIPAISSHQKISLFSHKDFSVREKEELLLTPENDFEKLELSSLISSPIMKKLRQITYSSSNNENCVDYDDDDQYSTIISKTKNVKLVSTDGEEFLCHRQLLMFRMSYFQRMFTFPGEEKHLVETQSCPRIPIVDMDKKILSSILDFVYLGGHSMMRELREKKVDNNNNNNEYDEIKFLITMLVNAQKYVSHDLTRSILMRMDQDEFCNRYFNNNEKFTKKSDLEKLFLSCYCSDDDDDQNNNLPTILQENEPVRNLMLPLIKDRWCSKFVISKKEVLEMIRKSYNYIQQQQNKKKKKKNSFSRFKELEKKVEIQKEEIKRLKERNLRLKDSMESMKKFLMEKHGYE